VSRPSRKHSSRKKSICSNRDPITWSSPPSCTLKEYKKVNWSFDGRNTIPVVWAKRRIWRIAFCQWYKRCCCTALFNHLHNLKNIFVLSLANQLKWKFTNKLEIYFCRTQKLF
jgi:hypothetical protein